VHTVLTTSPEAAAEFVRRGGLAAFPTETVYGLAARLSDPEAIERIFAAKGRPPDNPLIAHLSNPDQMRELAIKINENAESLINVFFPGPLTVVLRRSQTVPDVATAGLDTIGVRMPRNELARQFIEACGGPVAAPSANLSGRPSPTTWEAVMRTSVAE
jgi:L-threonylcarbamoyladenylate synthase